MDAIKAALLDPAHLQNALGILEIVWVNIVLSGDNAVVIALACRGLPPHLRRTGMIAGAGVAVGLRIVFTILITALLTTPFVKIVGGILLLWIGAKLLVDPRDDAHEVEPNDRLWGAIRTVAVADAVMSLDNVLAIAAVARGSTFLLVLGLLISVPLIVAGAAILLRILERLPILAWAGGVLLGWVAGEMIVTDPFVAAHLGDQAVVARFGVLDVHRLEVPAAVAGAVFVLLFGLVLRRRSARA